MIFLQVCIHESCFFLKRIRELSLAEYARTDAPWCKIHRRSLNRQSISTVQAKTLRTWGENTATWYSNSVRWPVITPNAPLRSIKQPAGMLCKSTPTLIHHFSFPPLSPEEKTPRPWIKASNHRRTAPRRNARFEGEFFP
jgi:hypothetical protein